MPEYHKKKFYSPPYSLSSGLTMHRKTLIVSHKPHSQIIDILNPRVYTYLEKLTTDVTYRVAHQIMPPFYRGDAIAPDIPETSSVYSSRWFLVCAPPMKVVYWEVDLWDLISWDWQYQSGALGWD